MNVFAQIIQFPAKRFPSAALTVGHFNMAQRACQFNQHFVSVNVLGNFSARGRTIDGPFKRFSTGHR